MDTFGMTAPGGRGDLQRQIDDMSRQMSANRVDIDALQSRAEKAEARSDDIEERAVVDREMLAELQADGVLSREHVDQLEGALRSSRTIGAAIGIIMAVTKVDEDAAFKILARSSQHKNRKLRDIAQEVVEARGLAPLSTTPPKPAPPPQPQSEER